MVIAFLHIWQVFSVSAHFEHVPCPHKNTTFLFFSMQILHAWLSSISAILLSKYRILSALGCLLFRGITLPSFVILRVTRTPQCRHFFILEEQSSQAGLWWQGSNSTFSSESSEHTEHSAGFLGTAAESWIFWLSAASFNVPSKSFFGIHFRSVTGGFTAGT